MLSATGLVKSAPNSKYSLFHILVHNWLETRASIVSLGLVISSLGKEGAWEVGSPAKEDCAIAIEC